MSETSQVHNLFAQWRAVEPVQGREPFYAILASVDLSTLRPDPAEIARASTASPEHVQLKRLWEAWLVFLENDRRIGRAMLREIARALFFLPEPQILVGAAALTDGDRFRAIEAFRRGVRADNGYTLLYDLLEAHGPRTDPPIRFLARDHMLNSWLGRGRRLWMRARKRRRKTKTESQ